MTDSYEIRMIRINLILYLNSIIIISIEGNFFEIDKNG